MKDNFCALKMPETEGKTFSSIIGSNQTGVNYLRLRYRKELSRKQVHQPFKPERIKPSIK